MLFRSLIKGITLKICRLCFVLIKSVLLNLLCVWILGVCVNSKLGFKGVMFPVEAVEVKIMSNILSYHRVRFTSGLQNRVLQRPFVHVLWGAHDAADGVAVRRSGQYGGGHLPGQLDRGRGEGHEHTDNLQRYDPNGKTKSSTGSFFVFFSLGKLQDSVAIVSAHDERMGSVFMGRTVLTLEDV